MYEKAAVCRFGVCVSALVFACLLCFGGCGNIGGDHDVVEGALLVVRSGEESTSAYARLSWSETWSEADRSFLSADMAGIKDMLDDLVEYPHFIESITYDGGVTFEPREDVSVGNLDIYIIDDGEVKELMNLHNSPHDVLDELEAGEYYVVANVTVEGELIEVAAGDFEFEKEGYDCLFKLIVE